MSNASFEVNRKQQEALQRLVAQRDPEFRRLHAKLMYEVSKFVTFHQRLNYQQCIRAAQLEWSKNAESCHNCFENSSQEEEENSWDERGGPGHVPQNPFHEVADDENDNQWNQMTQATQQPRQRQRQQRRRQTR